MSREFRRRGCGQMPPTLKSQFATICPTSRTPVSSVGHRTSRHGRFATIVGVPPMNSPFPGMDPYLESRWSDVHATLIALIKEVLQPSLPRALRARSEERVLLETLEGDVLKRYAPDVAVITQGGPKSSGSGAT